MNKTYAIVDTNGAIINVTLWDGVSEWSPPAGTTAVQIDDAAIGGTYIGGVYTPPVQPPPPVPTPAQLANLAITAGINITSTGTPSLNGTYSVGPTSQSNANAVATYLMLKADKFPGNNDTMPWSDKDGGIHIFPDAATFKAFAVAMADFVAVVAIYGDSNGQVGSIPSANITII